MPCHCPLVFGISQNCQCIIYGTHDYSTKSFAPAADVGLQNKWGSSFLFRLLFSIGKFAQQFPSLSIQEAGPDDRQDPSFERDSDALCSLVFSAQC